MAIHEQLPRHIHHELKQVGWTKAAELAKVARRDGQKFDCATWLHKANELPKEDSSEKLKTSDGPGNGALGNPLFQTL